VRGPPRQKAEAERQTTKEPGRKIFGEILDRICADAVDRILTYLIIHVIFYIGIK